MELVFNSNKKILIGVIHLDPLPGAPRWGGSMESVRRKAVSDARAYERGGADALILENFGDVPFLASRVGPETVAAMSVVGSAVSDAVGLPIGFNVLRNDARAALALCAAGRGGFVRVNVHSGAAVADQGILEGEAAGTLRYRAALGLKALILADVQVKHAVPLGSATLADSARDTWARGLADGLIVTGPATGLPARLEDVQTVREACPEARILLGSGVRSGEIESFLPFIDGVIVGTSLKGKNGRVDPKRVSKLARCLQG